MGTNDARLIALDAKTGAPCADFGDKGEIRLDIGKPLLWPGEFQITSAPVVTRGVVVVGSSIADNVRVEAPLGTVRAFDARQRQAALEFRSARSTTASTPATPMSGRRCRSTRRAVWCSCRRPRRARISAAASGPGDNEHADSVVALQSETGELAWSFQTVHHDVWDYDLPAQPTLARIETERRHARRRDPADQAGLRLRARPRHRASRSGRSRSARCRKAAWTVRSSSPTQPFPTHVPPLMPQQFSADDEFRFPPVIGSPSCHALLSGARNDGLYTPPSTPGTGTLLLSDDWRRRELG